MEFYQITADKVYELKNCLKDLADYHNHVSLYFKGSYPSKPFSEILRSMQYAIENKSSYIEAIKTNENMIGFYQCSIQENIGVLDYLFVQSDERKKGYGGILFHRAMDYMNQYNLHRIDILVIHGNTSAEKFYEKYGFKIRSNIMSK